MTTDAERESGRAQPAAPDLIDPTEQVDALMRELRTAPSGLSAREAERRLRQYGPNVLVRRGGRRWPRELVAQFVHPLALLLWMAAALALVAGIVAVAVAMLQTAALTPDMLLFVLPFPFIVWGADELRRLLLRRSERRRGR